MNKEELKGKSTTVEGDFISWSLQLPRIFRNIHPALPTGEVSRLISGMIQVMPITSCV